MAADNIQGLETLEAWKKSKSFAVKVYKEILPLEKYNEIRKLVDELVRIVNGYIAYLKRAKVGANEPGANYTVREESALYSSGDLKDIESLESQ